jgi:hypothetical protein
MNVNLHRELEFLAGFYIPSLGQKKLQCNRYKVLMHLITATEDFHEINIAMDRVKVMIHYEFSGTVFVHSDHREEIEQMQALGINVTTLPEEPLDQIVGIMLYCKFNAIMEQRMQVSQLDIASDLGDTVWYQHFDDDNIGPFATGGWWHHSSIIHTDVVSDSTQIPLIPASSWAHYDLCWPQADEKTNSTVVYADFGRNEN